MDHLKNFRTHFPGLPFLALLTLSVLVSVRSNGQVAGGTFTGTVTDASGAVVPNAQITITNTATAVSTTTATNPDGIYTATNLLPAVYDITVSAPGFSTLVRSGVTLTVGAVQSLNFTLKLGQVTEKVQVTGEAPAVELVTSSLSGQVARAQIVELPLNGRDWAQLATLQNGVASVRPHEAVDAPGGSTRGLGVQLSVNGARPQQNVYRLNGVVVNDYSNAGPGNVLGYNSGVDAIQEFSVLTSNYSAEYGFTSGGVVNAITKSGTNQIHGSAYEFLRNGALDAADFFENAAGEKKGAFIRNQFGGSLGAPVKKDKFFLFGDYEGLRQVKAVPQFGKVLTANARLGIINGSDGNPLPALVGPCPYPNETNLAPGQAAYCVDNNIAKTISGGNSGYGLAPLPNGTLFAPDFNIGKYNTDGKQGVTANYATIRGDFRISNKDSLNGSWYWDHSTWSRPDRLNQAISGFEVPHNGYTLEENHIFSSAMVNTIRLGYNRSDLLSPAISTSNPVALDKTLGVLPGCTAPGITVGSSGLSANSATVTGFGGFTGAQGFYARTGILQVFDDVARTSGKHNLKFGFMYLDHHDNWGQGAGCGGSTSFAGLADFLNNIPLRVRMPILPPFTAPPTTHHYRSHIYAGYVQDDWKVRPYLTLNVGLRYEMQTIPEETQDKINQLMHLYQNPGTSCVADFNGVAVCPGFYHQTFQDNPTTKNFEPRIGFAWDPFHDGKTSVRGGFGVFDVLPLPYMFALNSLQTSPNGAEVDLHFVGSQGQGTYPYGFAPLALGTSPSASGRWGFNEQFPKRDYVYQWNFNVQRQVTPSTSVTLAYAGSRGLHNPFQTDELNTVDPYKTSAGWLFPNPVGSGCLPAPPDCTATDAALGLPPSFNANPTAEVPGLLINPYTALIQSTIFQAKSWYNSFQARVDKRLSHGFQAGGSFTWGKSIDTSSSSFAGDNYANNITPTIPYWDLRITKGLSDFNVTRNLVINALWQAPTPHSLSGPAAWFASGWGLGAVLEFSDGTPMWPLDGIEGDPMGQLNGEPMAIPDVVAGCQETNPSSGRHGALQYINPSCFFNAVAPSAAFFNTAPPFGCDAGFNTGYAANNPTLPPLNPLTCINLLGNLGRNTVVGPGLANLDFSVVKDNHIRRISEAFNIQFRAEFFNILNRTNFAAVNANDLEALAADGTPVPNFGTLSATQVPMREIQFALKIVW